MDLTKIEKYAQKKANGRMRVSDVGSNKLIEVRRRDDDNFVWEGAETNAAHLDDLINEYLRREEEFQASMLEARRIKTNLLEIKTDLYG